MAGRKNQKTPRCFRGVSKKPRVVLQALFQTEGANYLLPIITKTRNFHIIVKSDLWFY